MNKKIVSALILSLGLSGCVGPLLNGITDVVEVLKGNGLLKTETRQVEISEEIEIEDLEFEFEQSETASDVQVEADENLQSSITTQKEEEKLIINTNKSIESETKKVKIRAPKIKRLKLSGASRATLKNIDLDLLQVELSGASKLVISGQLNQLILIGSGSSRFEGEELKAKIADVRLSGASKGELQVSSKLKVKLSGASRLSYAGEPETDIDEISGASRLEEKQ